MRYMAFSKLAGVGSECGPGNGLNNLMKQFGQDRALQQDRFLQQGESSKVTNGFRSYQQSPAQSSDNLANEFFQQQQNEHIDRSNVSSPFQPVQPLHLIQEDGWTRDFIVHYSSQPSSPHHFEDEFEHIYQKRLHNKSPIHYNQPWSEEFSTFYHQQQVASSDVSEEEQMAFDRAFEEAVADDGPILVLHDRDWDKEFADHEHWEAEYHQKKQQTTTIYHQNISIPARSSSSSSSSQMLLDVKDWSEEFSKYHDLTTTTTTTAAAATAAAATAASEMQQVLSQKSAENDDDWIQQYQNSIDHMKSSQDDEWEGGLLEKEWNRLKPDGKPYGYRAIHPEYEKYHPMADNPYLLLLRQDAIDGLAHTSLADAILALEAKAQLNPDDAKTWEQLGLKQQENERDAAAITALEKAVAIDANCLDAWLALSVSYTNEHCRMDAYNCLEQWIAHSPKYKHILQEELGRNYTDEKKRHDYITNLFLEAARTAPGAEMDADVQVGLGVLFNMSEEYGKAVDCFKSALMSRPHDYQLWNKVGATLANSRDSMGAIEMYFNALQINPSFVRARYNLAISCMNLGQHQEAAEHLLTALALQRAAALSAGEVARASETGVPVEIPNGTSDAIWDSLRLLMYMMSREDLATQCDHHNLDAFHGQFDF